MSVTDWAGLAVSLTTLIGVGIVAIRHLVRTYLMELKPNGGSSLRDEQNRQGETIKRLEERIDSIYELLVK
jgi:hypothetical protein